MEYCQAGWLRRQTVEPELIAYWKVRSSLTVHNCLLLHNDHIVVPSFLREETMSCLHEGHQDIEQCQICV